MTSLTDTRRLALPRRARSLKTNAALALGGDLAAKGAQLTVVIVCARLLPVSEMALLGICLAAATLLMGLLDAGVSVVITRDGATSGSAATLLLRSTLIRLPLVAAVLVGAVVVGSVTGHLAAALLTAFVGLLGAVSLSVLAVYRAQQDLSVEAGQKLVAGLLSLAAAAVFVTGHRVGAAALAGLALGPFLTLPSLVTRQWVNYRPGPAPPARRVLADALPFGAMALATVAYYRMPTLVLGAFSTHAAVAQFTVAATLGFGALALANAITTGLLPRLSSLAPELRPALARDSLAWTVRLGLLLLAVVVAGGPRPLETTLGEPYGAAFAPLVVLLVATLLIGASGVLGTALTVERRTGVLMVQVAVALLANIALALVLAPRFGSLGAAFATLLTELVAIGILLHAARSLVARPEPVLVARIALALGAVTAGLALGGAWRAVGGGVAAAIVVLVLIAGTVRRFGSHLTHLSWGALHGITVAAAGLGWASISNQYRRPYGMRVISDTPTYLAIVEKLAATPMHSVSVFMRAPQIDDPHATPYTQGIALVWRLIAGAHAAPNPVALERLLQVVGLGVTAFVLHASYIWVRRQAGRRAAVIAIPVLLLLFGPAHIIWAGDLTFHGFLYAAYFPQTVATGFMLWTLIVLDGRPEVWRFVVAPLAVAATLVVHPFTGTLLAVLVATSGAIGRLTRRESSLLGGFSLLAGYLIASRWPEYSLSHAIGESGLPGLLLIGVCVALPSLVGQLAGLWRFARPTGCPARSGR